RSGGTLRPRVTLSRNGRTSSGCSGPPNDANNRACAPPLQGAWLCSAAISGDRRVETAVDVHDGGGGARQPVRQHRAHGLRDGGRVLDVPADRGCAVPHLVETG